MVAPVAGSPKTTAVNGPGGPRASDAPAKALLERARSHLGWHEGPNNANPYTRHVMGDANQPWCAAFVSTMLEQENIPGVSKKMFSASARGLATQFQQAGRFVPSGSKPPQPGDAIFFGKRPSEHHVGIVQKVENGKVYTIEGNSSDKVSERVYNLNDPGISGYGRVFGEGAVSGDVGVDTSKAGQGTAGNSAPRATGAGSYHRSLDNGVDASAYFNWTQALMMALMQAIARGDPSAVTAALAQMLPGVSMEDLGQLAQLLQQNPELAAKVQSNPELLQQLAANPTPESVQAVLGAPAAAGASPAPKGWTPPKAVSGPAGGWQP